MALALGVALLALPSTTAAQAAMPRHVDDLVSEVLVVIDEVTRDKKQRKAAKDDDEGEARQVQLREGGILPFTRTVVSLLWKGLPVQRVPEGETGDNPVRIRIKPSAGGGQVRCLFTF